MVAKSRPRPCMDDTSIERLATGNEAEYERYVSNHRDSHYGHSVKWKHVIERSMDHSPAYLVARRGGRIEGVFPMFEIRSRLWGFQYVSVPAANMGGVLADDRNTASLLVRTSTQISRENGAGFLQVREYSDAGACDEGTPCDDSYITTEIDLDKSEEEILKNASRKVAQELRQAERNGLSAVFDTSLFDDFYRCYSRSMHRLGTPPYSKAFFAAILDEYGHDAYLLSVLYRGKVIASNLGVGYNRTLYSIVAGAYGEYRTLKPDTFFCWKALQFAKSRNLQRYCMGRSVRDSGVADFKRRWKGRERGLRYYYYLNRSRKIPVRNADSPLYRTMRRFWRLLPEVVATRIGHRIISRIN